MARPSFDVLYEGILVVTRFVTSVLTEFEGVVEKYLASAQRDEDGSETTHKLAIQQEYDMLVTSSHQPLAPATTEEDRRAVTSLYCLVSLTLHVFMLTRPLVHARVASTREQLIQRCTLSQYGHRCKGFLRKAAMFHSS